MLDNDQEKDNVMYQRFEQGRKFGGTFLFIFGIAFALFMAVLIIVLRAYESTTDVLLLSLLSLVVSSVFITLGVLTLKSAKFHTYALSILPAVVLIMQSAIFWHDHGRSGAILLLVGIFFLFTELFIIRKDIKNRRNTL